jgi:GLPGLI family protein
MKFKLILIFLLIANLHFSQNANKAVVIEVIYQHSLFNNLFNYEASLIVNDSLGQYTVNYLGETKEKDGIIFKNQQDVYTNIYNYKSKKSTEQKKLQNKEIIKSNWKSDFIWQITKESKIINGYKAIKATTDSYELKKNDNFYFGKAIAWFTTEIPIPLGPARYSGLPGLILLVEFENSNASYSIKSLKLGAKKPIKNITSGRLVSKSDILYSK